MFDGGGQFVQRPAQSNTTVEQRVVAPSPGNPEPAEKPAAVKTIRRVGNLFTPSIKDALAGKVTEKTIIEEIAKAAYSEYEDFSDPFTAEQLAAKWKEYLELISDRPNLVSTLAAVPELMEGNKLLLKIGNSAQEEDVRQIKPELMGFLRKELRNSGIELQTSIEKVETERTHLSDQEKMQVLIQKNPELIELAQKFNLGFNL
jgi:hypothetical protein